MELLDFEIQLSFRDEGYWVEVARSPVGESQPEPFVLPLSSLELEKFVLSLQIALLRSGNQRRRLISEDQTTVQELGRILFDALLPGEPRSLYYESRNEAYHRGAGLRIKLRIEPPDLAALPWEFLYDDRADAYLGMSRNSPIVRYLSLPTPVRPLAITPPLRILAMIAAPSDQQPLNISGEQERLTRALAPLQQQGLVQLDWLEGDTWRDLQGTLYQNQYHIFHFVGHGYFDEVNDEGIVIFCDRNGRSRHFGATDLARLLADQTTLRLCILNNCEGAKAGSYDAFASTAATLVKRGIPAVIAMQYDITDEAAIQLAESFYSAVAGGLPVDAALSEARKGMNFARPGSLEWGTPVLFMRSDDGRIFDIDKTLAPVLSSVDEAAVTATVDDTRSDAGSPAAEDVPQPPDRRPSDTSPRGTRTGIWFGLGALLLIALIVFGLSRFLPFVSGEGRGFVPWLPAVSTSDGSATARTGPTATSEPDVAVAVPLLATLVLAETTVVEVTSPEPTEPTEPITARISTRTSTPTKAPTPRATPTPSGQNYFDLGVSLLHRSQYGEAIEQFDLALDAGYETAELFHHRGLACHEWHAHESQCSYEQAIADFTIAIELDPDNATYFAERGWNYKFLGDLGDRDAIRESYGDYTRATELEPENAVHWRELGWRAKELGYVEEALAYFDKAIELVDDTGALVGRALVYHENFNDDEQALRDFTAAVASAPDSATVYLDRGYFYRNLDEWQAAVNDFSKAMELEPEWVNLYLDRGDAFQQLCQIDRAQADYKRFLEMTDSAEFAELADQRDRIQHWLEIAQDSSSFVARVRIHLVSTSGWVVLTVAPGAEILCQQLVEVSGDLSVANLDGARMHLNQTDEDGDVFEAIQDFTLMVPRTQGTLEFVLEMGCFGNTTVEISSLHSGKTEVVERYESAADDCDHQTSLFVDTARLQD